MLYPQDSNNKNGSSSSSSNLLPVYIRRAEKREYLEKKFVDEFKPETQITSLFVAHYLN